MDGTACPFIERPAQSFILLHLPDDGRTAAICPGLHVHEGLFPFVKASETVHDRAQGEARQFLVFIAQLSGGLADDFLDSFQNLERTFFGPVRMGRQQG